MKKIICILLAAVVWGAAVWPAAAWAKPAHAGMSGTSKGTGFAAAPSLPRARAGRVKVYLKIKDFSCIQGGYMAIRLKKKWVAQIGGAGKFLIGYLPAGRRAKFYAQDATGAHHWGPASFYLKPNWTWFVWTLKCY